MQTGQYHTQAYTTPALSYSVLSVDREKGANTTAISLEMGNIWRRVKGVIGNVQEVTMLKSVCRWAKD